VREAHIKQGGSAAAFCYTAAGQRAESITRQSWMQSPDPVAVQAFLHWSKQGVAPTQEASAGLPTGVSHVRSKCWEWAVSFAFAQLLQMLWMWDAPRPSPVAVSPSPRYRHIPCMPRSKAGVNIITGVMIPQQAPCAQAELVSAAGREPPAPSLLATQTSQRSTGPLASLCLSGAQWGQQATS